MSILETENTEAERETIETEIGTITNPGRAIITIPRAEMMNITESGTEMVDLAPPETVMTTITVPEKEEVTTIVPESTDLTVIVPPETMNAEPPEILDI